MTGVSDEDPLDLAAVTDDELAIEALRSGSAPHDPDLALDLMYALLQDVERALPDDRPVTHGTTIIAFATPRPERRLARNGPVVVAFTAGLLSLGGVAAASTLAPEGSPLHGLGEAFRSAAGAVVGAVAPPETSGRSGAARPPTATPAAAAAAAPARTVVVAPQTPAPGATVSAAVRSRAAARQVDALLDDAADLLAEGRTTAAVSRLDLAERRLAEVLPADRADLPQRLASLRAQTAPPAAKPTRSPKPEKAEAPAQAEPGAKAGPGRATRTAPPGKRSVLELTPPRMRP